MICCNLFKNKKKNIITIEGDFSFIIHKNERYLLNYDYKAIDRLGQTAWDTLRNNDFKYSFRINKFLQKKWLVFIG